MASVTLSVAETVTFALAGNPPGSIIQNQVAASSDPAIATVTLNADGITGNLAPTGIAGSMQVLIAAQNTNGDAIKGSGDATITPLAPPLAVAVDVTFGTPTPK